MDFQGGKYEIVCRKRRQTMVKKIFNFCLDGSEAESSNSEAEEEEIAEELLHKTGGQSYHAADQFD